MVVAKTFLSCTLNSSGCAVGVVCAERVGVTDVSWTASEKP